MPPVGLLVGLAGYWLIYFGVCSIQGPGVGLVDLIVPGRYKGHTHPSSLAPDAQARLGTAIAGGTLE